jgi:hypothetical protein
MREHRFKLLSSEHCAPEELDCFVAGAPRNDGVGFPPTSQRHCEEHLRRRNPVFGLEVQKGEKTKSMLCAFVSSMTAITGAAQFSTACGKENPPLLDWSSELWCFYQTELLRPKPARSLAWRFLR